MTISIKTKVVVKFGSSEMMYVDLKAKNLHFAEQCDNSSSQVRTEHPSTMSPVNEI